ncbi:unnamed protein product [Spirodela intermedia]|uniref:Uncharacterized protein n=1 Tax=Spirodela intermedia TaxID=51605 RepID=A0A7I8J4B9_SPIIN|nr:unnamed protein product [Spirodela intermedia]CAA6665077.1 unnamed protein product [Spirodela intermedia]
MGVLGNIVDALGFKEKCTTLKTVSVKVKMDCKGCEKKVSPLGGRDRKAHRADVTGYVEAEEVLRKLKFSGKKAPRLRAQHQRRRPPGPVYKQSQAISAAFSDDNPNGCSIM